MGNYNISEEQNFYGNLQYPKRVEFSTAFLWKCTIFQKSGSFNITAMGIYTFPEEWNFQQHPHGKIQYPRTEEASVALLCESTISQKNGSCGKIQYLKKSERFNNTAV